MLTSYIIQRQNALDKLDVNQFQYNSQFVASEEPQLNISNDYEAKWGSANINTSMVMKTHINSFVEDQNVIQQFNESFIKQLNEASGTIILNKQEEQSSIEMFDEIVYIDQNRNNFVFPYNSKQPDYDLAITVGSFSISQLDSYDIYLDLNVEQKELDMYRLLLVDIVNSISEKVHVNIFIIGQEIKKVYRGFAYDINSAALYSNVKPSNYNVNIYQLIDYFDNFYTDSNRTTVFIISKGFQCNQKNSIKQKVYKNKEFVFINSFYVKKINAPQNITNIRAYNKYTQQIKQILTEQQIYYQINLKLLNASNVSYNQTYQYNNLQQMNDHLLLQIQDIVVKYIYKGYTYTHLIPATFNIYNDLHIYCVKPIFEENQFKGVLGISLRFSTLLDQITSRYDEYANQNTLFYIDEYCLFDYSQTMYMYSYYAATQQGDRPTQSLFELQQIYLSYGFTLGQQLFHFWLILTTLTPDQLFINSNSTTQLVNSRTNTLFTNIVDKQNTKFWQIVKDQTKIQYITEKPEKLFQSSYQYLNSRLITVMSSEFFADKEMQKVLLNVDYETSDIMQFDDCIYFKAKFGTTECLNFYDNEIQLNIPWRSTNFYKMVNGEKIHVPVRNYMKDPLVVQSIQQLPLSQLLTVGDIQIALNLIMVIDAKFVWHLKLLRLVYFQQRQLSTEQFCVMIRLQQIHVCTKFQDANHNIWFYSFRSQNQRNFYSNQLTLYMDNAFRSQYSNCAGCYLFDDQTQILYTPRFAQSSISFSNVHNNEYYQLQSRIRDPIQEKAYFDIINPVSQYDLASQFYENQNQVIINQYTLFVAKPEQYSKKKPRYNINYYNYLEATVCQPQQFNYELTKLLFNCGLTKMYYQMDSGKYCVMNQMLNFTDPQICVIGNDFIEVVQTPGSGIYTVSFYFDDYQKYLNSQQYFNCFMFLEELNEYLTNLQTELQLKFEYQNDNIYSDYLFNITEPYGEPYSLQPVYEQRNVKFIINVLIIVLFVGAVVIYMTNNTSVFQ
ncbi:Conserved_hypothetical protein [Hexamita inflata]|uniref:Transmembrane protein n=1 Tax=Hexamita inflata TaxID=28002 RepID=A0ABP1JEE1_9EUKA